MSESEAKLKFLGEFEGTFFKKSLLERRSVYEKVCKWGKIRRPLIRYSHPALQFDSAQISNRAVEFSAKTATRLFAGKAGRRRCQAAKREKSRERGKKQDARLRILSQKFLLQTGRPVSKTLSSIAGYQPLQAKGVISIVSQY